MRNVDSEPGGRFFFYSNDILQHPKVLEAVFTKPHVTGVTLEFDLIGTEVLAFLLSLLSSSASRVASLDIGAVLTCAESDQLLASVLKTNRSLKHLGVRFDSDRWISTEMARVMREVNCTLVDHIQIFPVPDQGSLAYACQAEIDVYSTLNRCGRQCMRNMAFRPQKIPFLLKKADRVGGRNVGRYLYPLLRDNPAKWVAYLACGDA